jgi:hypothetical protein
VQLARAGEWKYLYRAVDRDGDTVDFLFTARRHRAAAGRFLERAIGQHGEPEKITLDKSGANTAAIDNYTAEHEADIEMRQCKYLRVQVHALRANPIGRHRDDAHDPNRAAGRPQRESRVRSEAVLLPGLLSAADRTALFKLIGLSRQNQ